MVCLMSSELSASWLVHELGVHVVGEIKLEKQDAGGSLKHIVPSVAEEFVGSMRQKCTWAVSCVSSASGTTGKFQMVVGCLLSLGDPFRVTYYLQG